MAISDETTAKGRRFNSQQDVCSATGVNLTPQWYVGGSRYPSRTGNDFEIFYSGAEVFAAVAQSIKNAKTSVDVVSWGFDPAIPLVRGAEEYQKDYVEVVRNGSYVLEEAQSPLQANVRKDGNSRQPIIYSGWREEDSYGDILLKALEKNENLRIRIVIWYYAKNDKNDKVQNIIGAAYTESWRRKAHIGRVERETGFDPLAYDPENRNLDALPLRHRHPRAQAYSSEWFHKILWGTFPGSDRIAFSFRDIKDFGGFRSTDEEDALYDRGSFEDWLPSGEAIALSFPTDHQKTILVDYGDDDGRHAYVMGHNSMTEYWSRFPFEYRCRHNEMDYLPYHDFSMLVKGPLTVDINDNFCHAWEHRNHELNADMVPRRPQDPSKPPARAMLQEEKNNLRSSRANHFRQIEQKKIGEATGQIVRTRPDETLNGGKEKDIKEAYLQAVRHARHYILIVNQYCQYAKLIRHIKFWRQEALNCGREGPLYILMGTCKPEQPGQVFRAHRMANELGLGGQFETAEEQMYTERLDSNGKPMTVLTQDGRNLSAEPKVTDSELKALKIKPLFFMFYAPAPQGELAQQVYVHAKLMVQDDVFFTMGSANLNIRSMAVDSELNLISDHYQTAKGIRQKLFGAYTAQEASEMFPNDGRILNQTQDDMKSIFEKFEKIAADNLQFIEKKEPIDGLIAEFRDGRGVAGVVRLG